MTQALFVQDLFTRFVRVRPMPSVKETTQTFADIVEESERRPRQLTVDKGGGFTANKFRVMCEKYDVELEIKDPDDLNSREPRDACRK